MQNQTLYTALTKFPLEKTGSRYTFLDRLCRENNWSAADGIRAIGEYKKFLYLARVSPVPVTPPPAVDQVWHLHLLYTRSYWDDLCQGVLGRALHHGPTAGGEEEDEKFGNWCERTRALYREEFGAPPPAEVWPLRFSPEKRPKPSFGAALPGVFPLLLLSGSDGALVVVFVCFAVLAVIFRLVTTEEEEKKKRRGDGADSGCGSFSGGSDCGDSGGGDCGGGDGCGGGCGGGD